MTRNTHYVTLWPKYSLGLLCKVEVSDWLVCWQGITAQMPLAYFEVELLLAAPLQLYNRSSGAVWPFRALSPFGCWHLVGSLVLVPFAFGQFRSYTEAARIPCQAILQWENSTIQRTQSKSSRQVIILVIPLEDKE